MICPPGSVRIDDHSCMVYSPNTGSDTSEDFCPTINGAIPVLTNDSVATNIFDAIKERLVSLKNPSLLMAFARL